MTIETLTKLPVWERFEAAARRQRRRPMKLLAEVLQERLEIWEDEALDEAIKKDAQKSGYTEDDAVEIVRQYRREKKLRGTT